MGSVERLVKMKALVDRFVHKYGRLPTENDPDYLEMLRMTKYIISDVPMLAPGKCGNCGASKNDGRKYIDFGQQIDWYGALYLCGECLRDTSREMGLFTELENQLKEAKAENEFVKELQEKGVELINGMTKMQKELEQYYDDVYSLSVDSNSNSSSGMVPREEATSERGVNKTESRTSQTKQGTSKSTASARPTDVPSLADILNKSGN